MKRSKSRIWMVGIHIVLMACAVSTIPVSMFALSLPDAISVIFCVALMVSLTVCLKKAIQKRVWKILLTLCTVLVMILSILGNYCNPYWNSITFRADVQYHSHPMDQLLTQKEAKEDLRYAMYYLEKLHPACIQGLPGEVASQYSKVLSELEEVDTISVCDLNVKIESIFSVLRDGHTYVKASVADPHYMKDIHTFNQGNYTLVAINGVELTDWLQQKKELYSYEIESWQMQLLKSDISTLEGLQYLGVSVENGIVYTYQAEDGAREDHTYYPEDFLTYDAYMAYNQIDTTQSDAEPFVQYTIDEENSLAVLTLNSCDFNDKYRNCLREMFTEVKEKGIQNVAVDLRNNGGGNSQVADEFIRYLDIESYQQGSSTWRLGWFEVPSGKSLRKNARYDGYVFSGNVYVLSSADTFSSAMLFAQYVVDNHLGTLIGETPGNTPNGYGEVAFFKLPNSQMFMQISTKEFFRADMSNPVNLVVPDIPCDSELAMDVLYEVIVRRAA